MRLATPELCPPPQKPQIPPHSPGHARGNRSKPEKLNLPQTPNWSASHLSHPANEHSRHRTILRQQSRSRSSIRKLFHNRPVSPLQNREQLHKSTNVIYKIKNECYKTRTPAGSDPILQTNEVRPVFDMARHMTLEPNQQCRLRRNCRCQHVFSVASRKW